MRLKSTSKEKQQEFIEHLKALFDNPESLIPECVDGGLFCNFNSYRKKVSSIAQSESYDKLSKSPDQLLSGLGETYKIMLSESAPLFGMMKTQFGSIEFAKRGNTDESVLVGIQHYDDPLWRMMAFSSLAKTKGSRIYSSTNYFLGSCKNTSPEVDFFKDVLKDENIPYEEKDGALVIGNTGRKVDILHLRTTRFTIYENSSYNVIHGILKHVLTPDIGGDFSFSSEFLEEQINSIPQQSLALYLSGKINDRTFIRDLHEYRISEATRRGYYVVGTACYTTPDELVDAFTFKYVEPGLVKKYLAEHGKGMHMESFSERKVLETIWAGEGRKILKEMFPDLSDRDISSLKGSPTDQIDSVHERTRINEIKSDIEIKAWSPDSEYLIETLKNYFTLGKEKCLREAEKNLGNSNVRKAIFYSIIDSLGESRNREWQFSDTERDLSWKIKPYISRILKGGPEKIPEEIENIRVFIR